MMFPNSLKLKLSTLIKNKHDISDLIEKYDLADMDFTGAIIKRVNFNNRVITNCNFSYCIFGEEGSQIHMSGATMKNCSFCGARFNGLVIAHRTNFQGSDFSSAFLPYFDYKYADLRKCRFCDAVFTLGTKRSYGALFDESFFGSLTTHWGVDVKITPKNMYGG